ncbi:PucR family transcriptional regulator [Nocardioides eburneiflavus]|uniref:PucR family transcriptional regulator n=2 Tax=Nocardioides eburneiflavus TaxID=2518372 RepID=A0A4Z1CPN2_9ACTN|nr:PucR family transcriptional regulator [Nocardioides eburneiflavus]
MAVVTVADVLTMAPVRAGDPVVVAGHSGLGVEVRWVHTTELADIAPLLRGGDLVLSTGIALPDSDEGLRSFAASLADSGAAGVIIELGRRWTVLPEALVEACDEHGLALVTLPHVVRFAAVAQAVGERVVDEQLEELRKAQRVHDTFTELSIAEAGPREVLEAAQRLTGVAVVLENEDHHVVDYVAGPDDIDPFLADWRIRSRRVKDAGRTTWDHSQGWLVTRLGKRGRDWGRLVMQAPSEPSQRLAAVAERAAAALAMHRLHDRHRDSVIRRTHHELILGLLNDPTDKDVQRRCEIAGLPLTGRQLIGLTIRVHPMPGETSTPLASRVEEVIAATVRAAHDLRTAALVCEVDQEVRALLSLPTRARATKVVDELAARVHRRGRVTIGAGRPANDIPEVDRTLREASQVVASVRDEAHAGARPDVHRLEDVHLRGLLTLLGTDERLVMFVDRELGALRRHDAEAGTDLIGSVRALVENPASKSQAAASLHLSRPVFYDRLAKVERLLGAKLDDPDIRVSLHVALLAQQLLTAD